MTEFAEPVSWYSNPLSYVVPEKKVCTGGPPLVRSPLVVEFLPDCYVVKSVLVEIDYVIPTSTNFA